MTLLKSFLGLRCLLHWCPGVWLHKPLPDKWVGCMLQHEFISEWRCKTCGKVK